MIKNNETPRTRAIYSGEPTQTPTDRAKDLYEYFTGQNMGSIALGVLSTITAHDEGAFDESQAQSALNFYEAMRVTDEQSFAEHGAVPQATIWHEQTSPDLALAR